ncbi:phosphocholine-specific phospholipase C [Solicola sp. PLA-1-18]|uniref:phosphocholine-specific phospholipase C n=1 Tax=Solicola sp. PLA-1-18 TaxID=3380532 RepID=UPI003B7CD197
MTENSDSSDLRDSSSATVSRRRVLGLAAAAGGVAASGSLLPASVQRAMAAPMRPGGLRAIEHVIVLMQENRSFDHYFGTMAGVRGFGDTHPLRLRSGRSVFHQPSAGGGHVLPFSLKDAAARAGRPASDVQYLGALPHGFTDATQAWADGWCDDWVAAKGAASMTYYEQRDLALQRELAETFTICDAYHCSVNGSTNPNRNYLWSGTTGTEPGSTARAVTNAAYDYAHAGYDWTTYPERLQRAGVSWQIYQEWDNFTDNAVEYFQRFKAIGSTVLEAVDGDFRTTEELYDSLHDRPAAEQDRLLAQLARGRARLTPADRVLFDRAVSRSRPGTLLERVRADIDAGTLPAVSWIVPPAADSEHPSAGTPVGSAGLVHDLLDAIASDPDTWSRTVLLINFDENDGYFDHVPPPVAPRPASGEGDDWYDGRPIGLGPRVPMTVVSPWSIGGHVSSEVFDHTSVIRFLERWTGVSEPNISSWRRTACGDLTSTFDFENPTRQPAFDEPGPVPAPVERWTPQPPVDQRLPGQRPGRRLARPLPYRPEVTTRVDGSRLHLDLTNAGRSASHLVIYPYGGELSHPEHLDVARRERRTVPVPDGGYSLAVQGPNRFWHELEGRLDGVGSDLEVGTRSGRGGQLDVLMTNHGRVPLVVRLRSLAHGRQARRLRLRPGTTVEHGWRTDRGWYDLEVRVDGDPTFRRRVTGATASGRRPVTP